MLKKRYLVGIIILLIILIATIIFSPTKSKPAITTNQHTEIDTLNTKDTLKLASYNIHFGYGYTNAKKTEQETKAFLDDIASLIQNFDIVALQEVDRNVGRTHRINEVKYLADKAGFQYYTFADNWNFKIFPYTPTFKIKFARTGHTILSKYPIINHEVPIFKKPSASLLHKMFFIWRSQQYADIQLPNQTLRVFNIHLESESNIDRMDQANQLVNLITESPHSTIILGDFNTLPPEATNQEFPKDNYENDNSLEIIRTSSLTPAIPSQTYSANESKFFTFPSRKPNRQLDYAFHSKDLELLTTSIPLTNLTRESSDHLPLFLEFTSSK